MYDSRRGTGMTRIFDNIDIAEVRESVGSESSQCEPKIFFPKFYLPEKKGGMENAYASHCVSAYVLPPLRPPTPWAKHREWQLG